MLALGCRAKTDNGRTAGYGIAGPEKVFIIVFHAKAVSRKGAKEELEGRKEEGVYFAVPSFAFISTLPTRVRPGVATAHW